MLTNRAPTEPRSEARDLRGIQPSFIVSRLVSSLAAPSPPISWKAHTTTPTGRRNPLKDGARKARLSVRICSTARPPRGSNFPNGARRSTQSAYRPSRPANRSQRLLAALGKAAVHRRERSGRQRRAGGSRRKAYRGRRLPHRLSAATSRAGGRSGGRRRRRPRVRVMGARRSGQRLHSADEQDTASSTSTATTTAQAPLSGIERNPSAGSCVIASRDAALWEAAGCERGRMRGMRSLAIRPVQGAMQIAVFGVSTAALPWRRS